MESMKEKLDRFLEGKGIMEWAMAAAAKKKPQRLNTCNGGELP